MNEIKYIKKYVEKLYLKNDPSHDFEHIMRVYKNAEKICNTENVNKKLVLISFSSEDFSLSFLVGAFNKSTEGKTNLVLLIFVSV